MEGGGLVGHQKVAEKSFVHKLTWLNDLNRDLFELQMSWNVAQLLTNITSLIFDNLYLVGYLPGVVTCIQGPSG